MAGLTVLAVALAYRGSGLGRVAGVAVIGGYLAFVAALAITVAQGQVRAPAAVVPAAVTAAAGILLLAWPSGPTPGTAGSGRDRWRQASLLPGWSAGRLWRLSVVLCSVVAAVDAASGPHLILIGLLIAGPCITLLTARWALTAAATSYAIALGTALGVPDQIFATTTQYALLAAVAVAGAAATIGAALLGRLGPRAT